MLRDEETLQRYCFEKCKQYSNKDLLPFFKPINNSHSTFLKSKKIQKFCSL